MSLLNSSLHSRTLSSLAGIFVRPLPPPPPHAPPPPSLPPLVLSEEPQREDFREEEELEDFLDEGMEDFLGALL